VTTPAPHVAWSYSQLKNYETCPKRYYHYNVAKDINEPESQNLRDGNALHKAFENRANGIPWPLGYGMYEPLMKRLLDAPGTHYAEKKLAMTATFEPRAYFGSGVWLRGQVDFTKILPDRVTAIIVDWKDGKVKEDDTQLRINATLAFVHMPELETVRSALAFVNHQKTLPAEYTRSSLTEIWAELMPRVRAMETARHAQEFPPKPSGLCRKWCAVVSCPHHGK
jgi:CRISPR/Cas system-associated exonuclease Cas4 (RecB family)